MDENKKPGGNTQIPQEEVTAICTELVHASLLMTLDNEEMTDLLVSLSKHPELSVRQCVTICIGHYIRIRKDLPEDLLEVLNELEKDIDTREYVVEAFEQAHLMGFDV